MLGTKASLHVYGYFFPTFYICTLLGRDPVGRLVAGKLLFRHLIGQYGFWVRVKLLPHGLAWSLERFCCIFAFSYWTEIFRNGACVDVFFFYLFFENEGGKTLFSNISLKFRISPSALSISSIQSFW